MRFFRIIPEKTFFFLLIFTIPALVLGDEPDAPSLDPILKTPLPGLNHEARVIRDSHGIAHIEAENDHDLYFLQGYVHAEDRLFQMDVRRRQAGGTLAELLGNPALESDVQLRTIGLRRAAERSLAAISHQTLAALTAYAEGVNAYVGSNPLPPEYAALEISQIDPWVPLDSLSVAKLITFSLSFDLDIGPTVDLYTYQQTGLALGFDGVRLYEDLFRYAPFDFTATLGTANGSMNAASPASPSAASDLDPEVLDMGKKYLDRLKGNPLFKKIFDRDKSSGSNEWTVSGALTENGFPLVANDPHLPLTVPSAFYPVHLKGNEEETDVIGNSFAGAPFVIVGHNRFISWGATINPMDVTDVFREQLVPDPSSPSGLSTIYLGSLEPVIPIPEIFRQNNPGNGLWNDLTVIPPGGSVPSVTLIVPRRNNGPIIQLDPSTGKGLSLQYTGFSPTRDLDTFLIWDHAKGLEDFKRGLQYFNVGSENLAYSDIYGNIAYFTSGEMPVREDLQAGTVNGLPPYFIRDGSGGNEWLPVQHPQPNQAGSYEILPFAEMPHVVNPPNGWFVNANNDPVGATFDNNPLNQLRPAGGIYYLNARYDGGFRAGRIAEMIRQKLSGNGKISFKDMQEIQADTVMPDAEYFVSWIINAFKRAGSNGADASLAAMAADPAVAEAVNRLKHWDFTSPTGIAEGFDAGRFKDGAISKPTPKEIASSIATTIYSVWRGHFIKNTIDVPPTAMNLPLPDSHQSLSALRHLLEEFDSGHGAGSAGINFFNVPGIADPADRRDFLILKSVADTLSDLAGPAYAAAFGNSTRQSDYRWGKLHRVVLEHPLGGPFNVPPAGGAFSDSLPGLPGFSTDGGFGTIDRSSHDVRAGGINEFMFNEGPANRYVSETAPGEVYAESSYPGGASGVPGNPNYMNLLPTWLWNDAFPLLFEKGAY